MAFRDNAYATVWEVKPTRGASMNVRISTSFKNKQSNTYETDFSDYVFFSGDAAKKAAKLKEKDRIKLLKTSVTSRWDKDKKMSSYTFCVWDFESAESGKSEKQPTSVVPPKAPVVEDDDECPF